MYPYAATPEFRSEAFSMYHIFSKISYYILISPYRTKIVTDPVGNSILELKRNKIQGLLCAFLHFWITVISVFAIYSAIFGERPSIKHNPTLIYDIAKALSFCFGNLVFIHMVRFEKTGLLFCYQLAFEMAPTLHPYSSKVAWKIWILLIFVTFLCIVSFVFGVEVGEDVGVTRVLTIAKQRFGLAPLASSHPIWDVLISGAISLLFIYRNFLINFTVIFLPFTAGLCILRISQEFETILVENPDLELSQAVALYSTVKSFVTKQSSALRLHILVYVISGITNFSSCIFIILDHENPLIRIIYVIFSAFFTIGMAVAAEGTAKFQKFPKYLYNNIEKSSYRNTLGTLVAIQDSVSRPIGLTAYQFPITYQLLFSVLSTVVTYAIILLQFKVTVQDVQ